MSALEVNERDNIPASKSANWFPDWYRCSRGGVHEST